MNLLFIPLRGNGPEVSSLKVLITFIVFVLIICLLPTFVFADNYIDQNYIADLNKEFDYNILTKNLIQLEEEYTDLIALCGRMVVVRKIKC